MKSTTIFAMALMLGVGSASAMTFTETVDSIVSYNPEVIKSDLDASIARAEIKSAGALSDPEIGGEYMWMPKDIDNRWNVGIEWGFDWFGAYSARKKEAVARADAFSYMASATELSQRQAVIAALTSWQLQKQRLALIESMASANKDMLELSRQRLKEGQISQLDANKIGIEVGRFSVRIEDERQLLTEAVRELTQLAGGHDVTTWLEKLNENFAGDFPLPSLDEVLVRAHQLPAVRAVIAQTEAARRAVKTAKAEGGPGITVGYKHLFEDGMHFNGVSLGITLPIFSNRGKVESARLKQIQAELEASATKLQEEATARALWQRAESLRTRLEPLREVFTTSDNFELLKQQYDGGQVSLHEYQEDKLYFLEAELEYLDLEARYRNALADLLLYR